METYFKSTDSKQKALAGAINSGLLSKQRSEQKQKEYELNPKLCKGCNNPIAYQYKVNYFCNRSCSATFNNRNKIKTDKYCLFCKKIIPSSSEKYCSHKCRYALEWSKWVSEIDSLQYIEKPFTYERVKRYLVEKYGYACMICKGTDWMGEKIPLILDHIDGNSDNNYLTNLRLVCGNCDMQLPTYKSKNLGNGRAYRRKRYAEGKSF